MFQKTKLDKNICDTHILGESVGHMCLKRGGAFKEDVESEGDPKVEKETAQEQSSVREH